MIYKLVFLGYCLSQLIGWTAFEGTTFTWEYIEAEGAELQIPNFPAKVKNLEGRIIELSGYHLPLEIASNSIVISKFPYASCFFCGGNVGPETVAEVQFSKTPPRFNIDDILHVKGRLILNEKDLDHLTFIIADATLIKK